MAKTVELKPEETIARGYADRLILEKLTELHASMKLSDIADKLQGIGMGLAAIRALLASNPDRFAYSERRWIPAGRLESEGRSFSDNVLILVDRFGGPMPIELIASELAHTRGRNSTELESLIARLASTDDRLLLTRRGEVVLSKWLFVASDEDLERAFALNDIDKDLAETVAKKLGSFDWRASSAYETALEKLAPVSIKALGAAAWLKLNPQDARITLLYDWREFNANLLSEDGYVLAADGMLYPESETSKWISTAVKLADKLTPLVEIEDAAPIEVQATDVSRMIKRIQGSEATTTASQLLEEFYEITPVVKTFPDDLANVMAALKDEPKVWWVGGDRFRQPNSAPDFVQTLPEPFQFTASNLLDEEGELVDVELVDDGLSSSLRKLLSHPLAMDVLDEDFVPAQRVMPESLRLVLKPIHRELGTFPLCQVVTGWIDAEPQIQELIFIDPNGRELQAWANLEARLLFNLIDWWYEQPIESGAVFTLTRTSKPNVFEFAWLDQTDPVVYISAQRMEELREIQSRSQDSSTLDILKEVMAHWPKGADFLTILWELNVVRHTSRRLTASLLSSYHCFYQRSGSPVWHYDAKKVDQGFDKTKRRFMKK